MSAITYNQLIQAGLSRNMALLMLNVVLPELASLEAQEGIDVNKDTSLTNQLNALQATVTNLGNEIGSLTGNVNVIDGNL